MTSYYTDKKKVVVVTQAISVEGLLLLKKLGYEIKFIWRKRCD